MNSQRERLSPVLVSLAVAALLMVVPLPAIFQPLRPYWIALVMIFWCLETQDLISLDAAFLIGLLVDLLTGSLLGMHALELVVLVYLVKRFRARLRFFPPWQQALSVLALLLNDRIIVLWIISLRGDALPPLSYWLSPVISTILWPWVFLIMDRYRSLGQDAGGIVNTTRIPAGLRGRPLKDGFFESRLLLQRTKISMAIVVLLILLLLLRYGWLQVIGHEEFASRSASNRVRVVPVAPNRGQIYDRRGRLIAENLPAYRLEVVPEKVDDLDGTLGRLTQIVDLPPDILDRFARERLRHRSFEAIPLKFNLSEKEVARFAVNRHLYTGIEIVPHLSRHYPLGELLTHVVGYVGRIDEDDLAGLDAANYRGTTHIGKIGIERQYETALHGRSGLEKVETNAAGRIIQSLERRNPVSGEDLILSIDIQVQQAAWDALGERPGAVVAMDPNDGSVIALVSKPAFDPNLFVQGISRDAYQAIVSAPGRAFFNRAIQGGYEPGSTFKPFVGLAGLELGIISRSKRIFSSGNFYLAGLDRPFRDWRNEGHGWVDIYSALEQSVNTYFYSLALDIGIDRLHDYLAQFGFGSVSGLDLPGEIAGILPSREWKRQIYNQPWYPGETVIGGIGQGFNVVTPVQLAVAVAALSNGGIRFVPHLLYASRKPDRQQLVSNRARQAAQIPVVNIENWNAVREGMRRVVHGVKGTARALLPLNGYEMAGKSGTAQVVEQDQSQEPEKTEVAQHLRNHALFVAFAPVDQPSIAVVAVVEHGGGGSRQAAPVAKAVIEAWLALDPVE